MKPEKQEKPPQTVRKEDFWERNFERPRIAKYGLAPAIGALGLLFLIPVFLPAQAPVEPAVETVEAAPKPAPAPTHKRSKPKPSSLSNVDVKVVAEMNLKAVLKDPDSAEFKDEFVSRFKNGVGMLCGKVNANNAFGGKTGFKRFIASPNPDAPNMIEGEASGLGASVDAAFPKAYDYACSHPVEGF